MYGVCAGNIGETAEPVSAGMLWCGGMNMGVMRATPLFGLSNGPSGCEFSVHNISPKFGVYWRARLIFSALPTRR